MMAAVIHQRFSIAILLIFTLSACTRGGPAPTAAPTLPAATATTALKPPATAAPEATATAPGLTPTAALPPPRFIGSTCPFQVPAGLREGETIRCGYVSVPANRSDPLAGTLQLAAAVVSPEDGPTAADPIIYLEGGPGGSALEFFYLTYERNFKPVLSGGRQIVIFDQRGVGASRPALDCPEHNRLFLELLDNEMNGRRLTEAEMDELNAAALRACAENLAVRADLAGFSTDENAADVADLAAALGFEQVNLWGVSYGTRLALEVMRDHPQRVRAAVLDSTVPPEVDLYASQPENLARAFDLLFESCAADPACAQAYPDLKATFFSTVERLDRAPAEFSAADPIGGATYPVAVSGDNLIDLMFQFLYDAEIVPVLPRLIANVASEKYDLLALLVGSVIATRGAISHGMHYALQCREEIAFSSAEAIAAAAADFDEFRAYFDDDFFNRPFNACAAMGFEPAADPSANQAVESAIPALILAGEFDPVTPPAWGERVAAGLENSYLYEFPGLSHGASFKPGCAQEILLGFLSDPDQKPDAACLDEMKPPQWVLPVSAEINLEPFTNEAMGIRGLKPSGWAEVNVGVYSRKSSALDVALLLAQAAPTDAATLLSQLRRQFGLAAVPESSGTLEANGLTWTLYTVTVRSLPVTLAIAEAGGQALVILLQSAADEHADLVTKVFNPVVNSVRPIR